MRRYLLIRKRQMQNDWIKFLAAKVTLDALIIDSLIMMHESQPDFCYIADGDHNTVRMAYND